MKMFVIDNAGKISAIQPEGVTEAQTTFNTECGIRRRSLPNGPVEGWSRSGTNYPESTASSQVYGPQVCRVADLEGRSGPRACCCPAPGAYTDEEGRVRQEAESARRRAQSQQNRNGAGTTSTRGRRHAGRHHERHRLAGAQRSRVHQRCAGQAHGLDGRISKARRREARLFRRKLIQTRSKHMRVAIYARVSTTDQTCDLQLRESRQYIAARGWEPTGEYVDTGWSGSAASRPEFDRLLNDARMRRIDAVLVWKLDRWGRSVAASVKSIQEFVSLGVRFIAITQISTPPAATLCLGSSCTSLRPSRSLSANSIRERVTAGVRVAKARGKQVGRPKRIFRRR